MKTTRYIISVYIGYFPTMFSRDTHEEAYSLAMEYIKKGYHAEIEKIEM